MKSHMDKPARIVLKPICERKPVLGAYASMARNNVYLTVRDIMDQLHLEQPIITDQNGKPKDLEACIWETALFDYSLSPEIQAKAERLLYSHFPFLKVAMDFEKQKPTPYSAILRCLSNAATVLGHIRDENLHYKVYEENRGNGYAVLRRSEHFWGITLKNILDAAPRMLKDRYAESGLIGDNSFHFFLEDRYVPDRLDRRKFTFNKDWCFNPQRAPKQVEQQVIDSNGKFINGPGDKPFMRVSEIGEILTIALFIEKGYTHFLLRDSGVLDGFKEKGDDGKLSEQRILKEIFSAYSIRLPERRLDSGLDATQVQLDMLNELRRCPAELYEVLPEEERAKFNIIGSDGSTSLQKRYFDRYVPMILRYLDTTESLKNIRFQVCAGALRYQLHGSVPYMDGEPRARNVQEKINAFGRIQDIEAKRVSADGCFGFPLIREDEDGHVPALPAVTDAISRYMMNGDLIGVSIRGDVMPVIEKNDNSSKYRVCNPEPDCWLSRYELPGLTFYQYLQNKYDVAKPAEDIIAEKVAEYREFFEAVADGRITSLDGITLAEKDIPEKLRVFLSGGKEEADFAEYKKRIITVMVKDTKDRLERIKEDMKAVQSKDNKPGKKSFVRIQPGKLASFLAADIVQLQFCPAGRPEKRLTGQQFSILRGTIATFAGNLESYCANAGLLSGDTTHPFLSEVFHKHSSELNDTVGFYRAYLEERLAYLKGGIPDDAPFLHASKKKWTAPKDASYYRALAKRYIKDEKTGRNVGIFLPSALFEEPIRRVLREHCPNTWSVIGAAPRANTAFMILSYFEEELKDGCQDFYCIEERWDHYGFATIIQREIETNGYRQLEAILEKTKGGLFKTALQDQIRRFREQGVQKQDGSRRLLSSKPKESLAVRLKSAYNRMTVNEKAIRRYMVQDITLFLLARLQMDKTEKLKLYDIEPEGKGILEIKVNIRTRHRIGGRTYLIDQEQVSVKDQGEIYKVLKDKRINSLLRNTSGASPVSLEDIKSELFGYNQERVPVIAAIQDYERRVYEDNEDWFKNLNERFNFSDIQKADLSTPELEKLSLRRIRNAFSHNQYPDREIRIKEERALLYSGEMPDIAKEIAGNADLLVCGTKK